MNRFITTACYFLVLTLSISMAQVNTESLRQTPLQKGLTHDLSFSQDFVSSGDHFHTYKLQYRADYAAHRRHGFLVYNLHKGYQDQVTYLDTGFIHLRFIQPLSKGWHIEVFTQREHNNFSNLQYRYLVGSGLRYPLRPTFLPNTTLHLGVGVMWEDEQINMRQQNTRLTSYVTSLYHTKAMTLSSTHYVQPLLSDLSDTRFLHDVRCRISLYGSMGIESKINLKTALKPIPPLPKHKIDITNSFYVTW